MRKDSAPLCVCRLSGTDFLSKASGFETYGFTRDATGITYREWAPAAREAYLMGDFNECAPAPLDYSLLFRMDMDSCGVRRTSTQLEHQLAWYAEERLRRVRAQPARQRACATLPPQLASVLPLCSVELTRLRQGCWNLRLVIWLHPSYIHRSMRGADREEGGYGRLEFRHAGGRLSGHPARLAREDPHDDGGRRVDRPHPCVDQDGSTGRRLVPRRPHQLAALLTGDALWDETAHKHCCVSTVRRC